MPWSSVPFSAPGARTALQCLFHSSAVFVLALMIPALFPHLLSPRHGMALPRPVSMPPSPLSQASYHLPPFFMISPSFYLRLMPCPPPRGVQSPSAKHLPLHVAALQTLALLVMSPPSEHSLPSCAQVVRVCVRVRASLCVACVSCVC